MTQEKPDVINKKNVSRFNEDVLFTGSYDYTGDRLSCRLANNRISDCIAQCYDFMDRRVLDLGCGDGTYTIEFPSFGVKKVVGVDPAIEAIKAANSKAQRLCLDGQIQFEVGNIYTPEKYLGVDRFDCIVLRGVLHHLSDPKKAIAGLEGFDGTIVVLEPNGNNPILKLLERYSSYHVEHEERSFSPALICSWLTDAGFNVSSSSAINLVPMFCPDWVARLLCFLQPVVEALPILRDIACGQRLIVANKS